MTDRIKTLLQRNVQWASQVERDRPGFFTRLASQQRPQLLWIGCADSRVPANQILGLDPGEVFVHRNVANLVHPADSNVLTVIAYAVGTLGVRDIIVCGHYGCGGVQAVHEGASLDLLTDWLWPIRTVARVHAGQLADLDRDAAFRRLCELNVQEQVHNVADTSVLRAAWAAGQQVSVHGLVYGLDDGRLHDLDVSITGAHHLPD